MTPVIPEPPETVPHLGCWRSGYAAFLDGAVAPELWLFAKLPREQWVSWRIGWVNAHRATAMEMRRRQATEDEIVVLVGQFSKMADNFNKLYAKVFKDGGVHK